MEKRATAGLIVFRSIRSSLPRNFIDELDRNLGSLRETLSRSVEFSGVWVVDHEDGVESQAEAVRGCEADVFLIVYLTQAKEEWLEPFTREIDGRPLVVWSYLPRRRVPIPLSASDWLSGSGALGAFRAFAYLRDHQIPFVPVFGSIEDPGVISEVEEYCRSAQVLHEVATARIGILRTEPLQNLHAPLFNGEINAIEMVDPQEVVNIARRLPEEQVDEHLKRIESVVDENLATAALARETSRLALALRAVIQEKELDVLSVSLGGLREAGPAWPCVGLPPDPDGMYRGIYIPQIDFGSAFAALILNKLSNQAPFFMHFWFWDRWKNFVVGGHGGMQPLEFADLNQTSLRDHVYGDGLDKMSGTQFTYVAHSGRVTLLQLRETPSGWQGIAMSGVCLESDPWIEGIPHAVVRLDITIDAMLEDVARMGSSNNWVMVYGSVLQDLKAIGEFTGIPIEICGH